MFTALVASLIASIVPAAGLQPHFDSGLSVEGDARLWVGAPFGSDPSQLVLERRGTQRVLADPVTPEGMPSADLGTDADGGLVAVFATCRRLRDCDVYAVDAEDPAARPRRVRFAARRGVSERAPTVDRGRLAWAVGDRVLVRRLDGRGPTREIPGALERRTDDVVQLELSGRHLASIAHYVAPTTGDFGVYILRLDGRTLLHGGGGLSGKHPVGLSFAEGKLGFHVSCPGEPGTCASRGGAFRYDPERRSWEHAPKAIPGEPEGFALLPGDRALIVRRAAIETVDVPFAAGRRP